MKKLKNKLITLRQNTCHYFIVLINIVHEKENQFRMIYKDNIYNIKYEFDQIIEITNDYANIQYNFLKDKKKIETRNRINEINLAKQDFMKSLNICEDIKRHIYSFL